MHKISRSPSSDAQSQAAAPRFGGGLQQIGSDSTLFQPPSNRIAAPQRLASCTQPDLPAVAREVARGASLASVWRRYAATATIASIGYVAFTKQVKKWHAAQPPRPEIAPGIPDYAPAEDSGADRYWVDRTEPSSSIHVLAGFGCSLKVEHGLLTTFDAGTSKKFEPINHRLAAIVFIGSSGIVTVDASNGAHQRVSGYMSSIGLGIW